MKITDIIRAALDVIERQSEEQQVFVEPAAKPVAVIEPEVCEPAVDEIVIIKQLSGMSADTGPNHVNAPGEQVSPIGAAFPAGDDMHHAKNPADIRTNAPSMYPGYQAGVK